jgi:hypothetical protein
VGFPLQLAVAGTDSCVGEAAGDNVDVASTAARITVSIDSTFALEDAAAAFACLGERNKKGKAVLVTGA